jgi:hypothetical protein
MPLLIAGRCADLSLVAVSNKSLRYFKALIAHYAFCSIYLLKNVFGSGNNTDHKEHNNNINTYFCNVNKFLLIIFTV